MYRVNLANTIYMATYEMSINALVEQTAMAVLGQIPPEQADIIRQRFIDEFGRA